ncbi:MAG: response regulator [Candidatus Eisenbacteria bacterium]
MAAHFLLPLVRRVRRCSLAAFATVAIFTHAARAVAAPEPYTVRAWTPDEGLPTSTVIDFARTPDGYFWVATTGGLARFDGLRFRTFGVAEGLPSNRFSGLLVARDGTLWATTDDGWLCHWDGRRFENHATALRMGRSVMVETEDGSILGASSGRVWRFRNGRATALPDSIEASSSLLRDREGRVRLTAAGQAPAMLEGDRVRVLGSGGRGMGRWIADPRDARVYFFRGGGSGADAELLDERLRHVATLPGAGAAWPQFVDGQGRLWCTTTQDLVAHDMRDGRVRDTYALALRAQAFLARGDAEGDVWVGTQTQGLLRVAPSPLRLLRPVGSESPLGTLFARERLDGSVIVVDQDTRAWRAGDRALLPTTLGTFGMPTDGGWEGIPETAVRFQSDAVEVRDRDGRIVRYAMPNFVTRTVAYDPRRPGTVYATWSDAVVRLDTERGAPRVTVLLSPSNEIRDLHVDREGRLWVATMLGLWRLSPRDTVCFTRRDGLPVDHVRQIHEQADGTLWIGTYGGGLVRLRDGRFRTLDRRHGLLEDVVSVVLEDDAGNLWLAGNRGIQRLSREQADACLDGRRARVDVVGYGRESGLRNPEGSGMPGLRARDGRLFFPTFDGLAVLDPRLAHALAGSPPVPHVEAVNADGRDLEPGPHGFVVPAGAERFEVRYTAFEPRAAEQLRFSYRLDGVDRDWVDAGASRTATYTNVPPGPHRFRLRATSGSGVASARDAEVAIEMRPQFWQTTWFGLLALVALVFAAVAAPRERERRLRARSAELQTAVDTRTAELAQEKYRTEDALATVEAQAQRLAALDRARSRFFASISHEFRTPLMLVHGPLQDVRSGEHGPLREDAAAQVDIALDNATRLHRLVDQLLDAARAEAGELRVEPVTGDFGAFLARLVEALAPLAQRKHITFTCALPSEPLTAAFDPQALDKVFANLLGNAFKFTPAHGTVELTARRESREGGDQVVVRVRDDGPGIAAEDLPHVFKRFYRAERSITRVQPGTGLGLALAWDLVEQHGGAIRVESREGEGSTFEVRLPLRQAEPAAAYEPDERLARSEVLALADEIRVESDVAAAVPSSPDANAPLVLVVDDHAQARHYIARQLASLYRVSEAADGRAALASMREEAPDLVVSDVSMPEMDGFALVAAMRADPELDFMPVILLTAAASEASRIAGLEGGADDYLTKPFAVRELRARIARALESRRRLRDRVARAAAEAAVYGTEPASEPAPGLPSAAQARTAVDSAFVRRLREVIESRMGDEDFDVDRLAEAMGMGRTLLFQRTGELLDETPMALVMNHRLERAAQLLRGGEGQVGEVAYAVGFRSVSHFTRRFRERFGRTPGEWRRGATADAVPVPAPVPAQPGSDRPAED